MMLLVTSYTRAWSLVPSLATTTASARLAARSSTATRRWLCSSNDTETIAWSGPALSHSQDSGFAHHVLVPETIASVQASTIVQNVLDVKQRTELNATELLALGAV